LSDRYELPDGDVFVTGIHALVRVLLDQHRADVAAGLRTATLVSGYQGSPLGGFDREVAGLGKLATDNEIVLRPALNEELGATAVWGSQLLDSYDGPRVDGVTGVWYGKSPGVDRASDAIRHGNIVGTHPHGGVLALAGDDPACKSSTVPGASEPLLAAMQVPVIAPGNVQEVLDFGRHAIACSRASGLWSALKVVTNVCDAAGTALVGADRVKPVVPTLEWQGRPYVHQPRAQLLFPWSLEYEQTMVEIRLPLAKLYARANGLNRVTHSSPDARIGVIASGTTAHDVLTALRDLGFDGDAPVRVLQVGMIYPLDEEAVREFAAGLSEIIVLEDKLPFLERLVKDALYGTTAAPPVHGKMGLAPSHGQLESDSIATIIGSRLLERGEIPSVRARLEEIQRFAAKLPPPSTGALRTPFFCSGCPHNTSTIADDDQAVGAGIGCHTMVLVAAGPRGKITGITQMGGEGAQWIGVSDFVETPHLIQNLGDGTFHHSGSLAIRAAVAAKVNITYKLLYNSFVAMTGGQHIEGQMSVPALVREFESEGVKQVIITSDDPGKYDRVSLPRFASVRPRSEILQAQRELRAVEGVTVLIHDQACAAELRRERKRGRAVEPAERIFINERVCEGCGDCGAKSGGCLSVEPVETEFGRKTRINQTSCNKDYSCIKGDCPSFLEVVLPKADHAEVRRPHGVLPEPPAPSNPDVRIRLVGIGGTGVVTVSQVLGMAALIDGRHVKSLDQTGLSQKAGPVVSDVRITTEPLDDGVIYPTEACDTLLALDPLGAASIRFLRIASPERTVAVICDDFVPTGTEVIDVLAVAPDKQAARETLASSTRNADNVHLPAQRISERLLGDATPANMVALGAALQAGLLPLTREALEQAIRLNRAGVERNLAAIEWGRAWVAARDEVEQALGAEVRVAELDDFERGLVDGVTTADGELRRLLTVRVPDLRGWGGDRAASRYASEVGRVASAEAAAIPGSTAVTEEVARALHKLMAYKDEYEVARLQVEGLTTIPKGARVKVLLHPPMLRAMGLKRKLKFGAWFFPFLRLLARFKFLRGTPLDGFGYAHVRRVERGLPTEYLGLVDRSLDQLRPDTLETVIAIAALPDMIRGYEKIKLANVDRFRAAATQLNGELHAGVRSVQAA
jgi:indolepyruvate ferredoxin oxidoreductase